MTQHLVAYGLVWLLSGYAVTLLAVLVFRFGWIYAVISHLWQFAQMFGTHKEVDFIARSTATVGIGVCIVNYNFTFGLALLTLGYVTIYANNQRSANDARS